LIQCGERPELYGESRRQRLLWRVAGIYTLDPKGKKLGRIVHGRPETTNIAFGGDDWKTLYFTNWNYLGAVKVKITGFPVPVAKKT
jgi:sugar lactone lactonase YvrE